MRYSTGDAHPYGWRHRFHWAVRSERLRPVPVELRIRRGTETFVRLVSRVPISQLYKQLQPAKIAFPMQTGLDAPTFKLQDMKNDWVSLADLRGKWVLLTF